MVYVITGGPGFGKTSVIDLLQKKGFQVCSEGARDLLVPDEKSEDRKAISPIPADFEQQVAARRIGFLQSVHQDTIAFSDRGLPDQIAYSWYKSKIPSKFIEEAVLSNKYAPVVFLTPPWEKIYLTDDVRKENFAEASSIHMHIVMAYRKYGYKLIDIPQLDPQKRVGFILDFLRY